MRPHAALQVRQRKVCSARSEPTAVSCCLMAHLCTSWQPSFSPLASTNHIPAPPMPLTHYTSKLSACLLPLSSLCRISRECLFMSAMAWEGRLYCFGGHGTQVSLVSMPVSRMFVVDPQTQTAKDLDQIRADPESQRRCACGVGRGETWDCGRACHHAQAEAL